MVSFLQVNCNQCYPNFENSSTQNTRLVGKSTIVLMELFEFFYVLARHKHQLQTSLICISARQSYLRYIVLRNCR